MAKIRTTHGPSAMVKIWIAVGIVFALVATVLIAYQLGRSTDDSDGANAAPGDETSQTGDSTDGTTELLEVANYEEWEVQPDRIAALPEATGEVAGLPTDFPQTEIGAVAYAIAAYEATSTNDPERMEAVVDAYYSHPRYGQSRDETIERLQQVSATIIENAGLSPDAELQTTVYGFAVTTIGSTVYVSRLSETRVTDGDQVVEEAAGATVSVDWLDGRWQFALASPSDEAAFNSAPARADAGTADFNAQGWTAIERAGQ